MQGSGEFGKRGEEIAAQFLERQGYTILERNYHTRYGEIDIIASKISSKGSKGRESTLSIVEVKTRRSESYGAPAEAVNYLKQQRLRKTALVYLQQQSCFYDVISFDVIAITVSQGRARIRWLPSCF